MDTVATYWAPGVFRELDHLVRSDTQTMVIRGRRYFMAVCGSVTVRPGTPVPGRREQCPVCRANGYRPSA